MSAGQYGGPVESVEERKARVQRLLETISWRDFIWIPSASSLGLSYLLEPPTSRYSSISQQQQQQQRRQRPWVLVPNGSLLGYFDWVPESLRVGPWSVVAVPYLAMHLYLMTLATIWIFDPKQQESRSVPTFSLTNIVSNPSESWPFLQEEYQAYTWGWYYNAIGFVWMCFILFQVYLKAGWFPMATYTMQSWTVLLFRHLLAALVPLMPPSSPLFHMVLIAAESLRFLALSAALITFIFWNFFIGPAIYFFFLKGPEEKKGFLEYMTNFRLTQLHIFNILYAVLNGVYCSPKRWLTAWDFYVAAVFATVYLLFYLLVLDRLGVHLYPIYSPRTPWVALTLTMNMVCYISTFYLWKYMIEP